jgi:hypothetical protein
MRHLLRQQGITTCLVDVASHLVKTFIHQVHPLKKLFCYKKLRSGFCCDCIFLKVPKREIFVTELIILSDPIWIVDLRTKAKNRFVRIVRLLFASLVFFR